MNIYVPAHNQKEIHTVEGSLADFITPTPKRTDDFMLSTGTVNWKSSTQSVDYSLELQQTHYFSDFQTK